MDLEELKKAVSEKIPESVLDSGHFGSTKVPELWLDGSYLKRAGRILRDEPRFKLEWLQGISFFQKKDDFVISVFLASRKTGFKALLRSKIKGVEASLVIPSLSSVWPNALAFEREISPLFGVDFREATRSKAPLGQFCADKFTRKNPLRKASS